MIRIFVLSITCLMILASITNVAAEEEFSPLKDKNIEEWHKIGASLISNGKYEESIKYYDKILEVNPNDANALLNKGSVLIELNKFDEAIKYYDKILEVNPNDANALTSKGIALSHLQKYSEAIIAIDKALLIEPDNKIIKNKKSNFLSNAPTISARDSVYDIKLKVTVRDSSGNLISISESSNTRYLPYEITDKVFEHSFKSKDIVTIDGKSYDRLKQVGGVTNTNDTFGMLSISIELDGYVMDLFQAFTPMLIIEKEDIVKVEWTILKEIN